MPISSDPTDTVPFVLQADQVKHDKAKAAGGQPPAPPTWHFRFHTARERTTMRKLLRLAKLVIAEADKVGDADPAAAEEKELEAHSYLDKLIAGGSAKWEGVKLSDGTPADPAQHQASAIVTGRAIWELAYATIDQPGLAEDDLRNFVPPSAGNGASSAVSAASPAAAPAESA